MDISDQTRSKWIDRIVTSVIATALSTLSLLLISWWNFAETDERELMNKINLKADKSELAIIREQAIKHTNDRFKAHEEKEQLEFNNVKQLIKGVQGQNGEILTGIQKIMEMNIKRMDRIEDKVDDIYKN